MSGVRRFLSVRDRDRDKSKERKHHLVKHADHHNHNEHANKVQCAPLFLHRVCLAASTFAF